MVTFARFPLVDHEVVIVGAGAAGVAAARTLHAAGVDALLVEARNRVGGRAYTVTAGMPAPLDMGCEWLHSADQNAVVPIARDLGLTLDTTKPDWGAHAGRNFTFEERADFQATFDRFWEALEQAAQADGPDRAALELLEPGNRWNPLIEAISTYYNGVELADVSIVDLDRYVDTGVNWRIAEGYGTFVERAASDIPLALGRRVRRVDHGSAAIRIETNNGDVSAHAVIITLPTNVLAAGALSLAPDLPAKRQAAADLPLGLADKIFFQLDSAIDLPSAHLYGTTDQVETISFALRPRGAPLVQGYVGGAFARELEKQGPKAFEAEARRQIGSMLGQDIQRHLHRLATSAWSRDPFALGSYSHARPGAADQRAVLAAPVDDRLFFAGEACSKLFFSTAHGAWETGASAAQDVISVLKKKRNRGAAS